MKYNQNKRIQQVAESTLIIGTDIAKNFHISRAQDFRGIEYDKPFKFYNTRDGFNRLLSWMRNLAAKHNKSDILFGVEPTGHYWLPLAQFLRRNKIKIVLVNPLHVKKSKELDDNSPSKNDTKDARVIAQLVKDGRFSEPNIPSDIYAELRGGMNLRDQLTKDLQRVQGRIHNWLDRFFPEFLTAFKDWEGKTALVTLKYFPLPQDVITYGFDGIMSIWRREIKRGLSRNRAIFLLEVAQNSIGITEGLDTARYELEYLLNQYFSIDKQIENLLLTIENLVRKIPGVEQMLTIPGVGLCTVAGFIAEVGCLEKYDHPRQLQKLAGLNLKENSSGKHKGQTKITKRGRPRLRSLLFKCVLILVATNDQFKALHQYFITRPINPLKKMQSIIALCCKLIRLLFAMAKKQQPYDPAKLMIPINKPTVAEVA